MESLTDRRTVDIFLLNFLLDQLVEVHESFTIEKGENFENNFLSTVSLFISFFLYQKFIFN